MNLPEHRIPASLFADLAAGGGGAEAVRCLSAAQYSKHVLLIRGVLDTAECTGHPGRHAARAGYDLLSAVQQADPGAVDAVLRHSPVGAWARRTVLVLRGEADPAPFAVPEQLAALAAAAAVRARMPATIPLPVVDGAVVLPSLGRARLPGRTGTATVTVTPDGATLAADGATVAIPADPHVDAPGWQGLRPLHARADGLELRVLVEDLDPFRMPGAGDLGERLTAAETAAWRPVLEEAWRLLTRHHRRTAVEVAAAIRVFTPLRPPEAGQVSATSRETFGCIALSAPVDACSLAVTLAHETQHAKLSALLDVVPLLGPDDGSRHYAPWRPDPRPLSGLLQGAYAYLGVTAFWRTQRRLARGAEETFAHAEFARWRAAAYGVTRVIAASGRLTPAGEAFVAGMERTLAPWLEEPVPADAAELARQAAERHLNRWRERNGEPAHAAVFR